MHKFRLMAAKVCLQGFALILVGGFSMAAYGQTEIKVGRQTIQLMKFDPQRPMTQIESDGEIPDYSHLGIKPEVDMTALQSTSKNQGSRGSCAYFAASALVEAAYRSYFSQEKEINMSEEYMIYYGKGVLGYSSYGDGSNVSQNLKVVNKGGIMLEEAMPYTENWFTEGLPCEAYKEQKESGAPKHCYAHYKPEFAKDHQLIKPEHFSLNTSALKGNMSEILKKLDANSPVTVAIPLHYDGWNDASSPVFYNEELDKECRADEDKCGGHAVLLVGYDLSKRVFIFKNSWGHEWGNDGFGTMAFEYIERWAWLGDFWTAEFKAFDKVDVANEPPAYSVNHVAYNWQEGVNEQGEPGYIFNMSYEFVAPIGSYYYVSLFPMIKTGEEQYDTVSYKNGEKVETLAARRYTVVTKEDQLQKLPTDPLSFFIPKAPIQEQLDLGNEVYFRPSVYSMSDRDQYKVLFREFVSVAANGSRQVD